MLSERYLYLLREFEISQLMGFFYRNNNNNKKKKFELSSRQELNLIT